MFLTNIAFPQNGETVLGSYPCTSQALLSIMCVAGLEDLRVEKGWETEYCYQHSLFSLSPSQRYLWDEGC